MVVTAKRQELKRPVKKKKNPEFISLKKSVNPSPVTEFLLLKGYSVIFTIGLISFLMICGTEYPYRYMNPVMTVGLNYLSFPDQELGKVETVRIQKADAGMMMPENPVTEKTALWDLPHYNYYLNKGDTISQISRKNSVSISTILSVNKIENVKKMDEGQKILIPGIDGILHIMKKGETLQSIINTYKLDKSALYYYNPYIPLDAGGKPLQEGQEIFLPGVSLPERELRCYMGELFIYPVQGHVIKNYGNIQDSVTQIESFHNGIDIKGESGDPVKAALDGKVIARGFNSSYGNYIILEHSGNYRSLYAHLEKSTAQKNDRVRQGDIIGELGMTGYTRIPHLHFSLFKGKKSIDPIEYLH